MVEPRHLVPTPRQLTAGATYRDYTFAPVDESPEERPSSIELVTRGLRDADPRQIPGSKRPLLLLALVGALGGYFLATVQVALPELQAEFVFDTRFLVAVLGSQLVVGDAGGVLLGWLADRIERVWMFRVGVALQATGAALFATADSVFSLALALVLAIAGTLIPAPAFISLVADYYPTNARLRAVSFYVAAGVLGGVVGQVVSGAIIDTRGWRPAVWLLAGAFAVGAASMFALREPPRGRVDRLEAGESPDAADRPPPTFSETFRSCRSITTVRKLWYASLFMPAAVYGFGFLPLYLAEQGLGPRQRGFVLAAAAVVTFLALPIAGAVTDRILIVRPGRVMTVVGAAFFVQATCLVVIAVSPLLPLALAAVVLLQFAIFGVNAGVQGVYALVIPARMLSLGAQTGKPFVLVGRLLVFVFLGLGGLFSGIAASPTGALMFVLAVPTVAAAFMIASASVSVAKDIRAAKAVALADAASKSAKEMNASKMLVCRDVDVEYGGVQVLFGVDFDVQEGETIALLGTNGAGKSTLLRSIAGTQQASSGAIFLDGVDITHAPTHENAARGIVMMPGGAATFPTMTVDENLRAAAWMYRDDETYVRERMAHVFDVFPALQSLQDRLAGNLSGGEQQMVGMGQALLMRPRLLMIDELSLGLAPAIVDQLLVILREIHRQGTTVILVEQSLNVALTIAERAVFMEKGEIRFEGSTAELLARPDLVRSVFMGGGAVGGSARRQRVRPTEASDAALEVDDVSVSFGGVHALRNVSFELRAAEVLGVIGPNGAGKTTLFDAISGFAVTESGHIRIVGEEVSGIPPDGRSRLGLARSFQAAKLFPSMTVRETVAVALERLANKNVVLAATRAPQFRRAEHRLHRRVDDLIDLLGLGAFANKFVGELSTGTRRAVDVACIMAAQPKVLLLDEPSSGLAQVETEELGPVLTRVAREAGCSMLLIEHDLPLVTSVSDRLMAMELGAVVTIGVPHDVVSDKRVLASYLAASENAIERSDSRVAMIAAALDQSTDGLMQMETRN